MDIKEQERRFLKNHQDYLALMGHKTRISLELLDLTPEEYIPKPTDADYSLGIFDRYFAQKVSDRNSPITEVDHEQHKLLKNTPFYQILRVRWRISGPLHDEYDGNIRTLYGVVDWNSAKIQKANVIMPGISSKLANTLQFYKAG